MAKSNSLKRNPLFVFGPAIALFSLGVSLIAQPGAFGSSQHKLILDRIQERESIGWVVPQPELTEYLYPRLATELPTSAWLVVNKNRPLNPIDFVPEALEEIESSDSLDNSRGLRLTLAAARGLEKMAKQMFADEAGQIFVNAAFRTFERQGELFASKVDQYGEAEALLRSAKAGYSEHQTGLAVDVSVPAQGCAIMVCFGDTVGGKWIAENSWRFGYVMRYEQGVSDITGYTYEPWHLRYIGVTLAKKYHDSGMKTLEEFWSLPPAPFYPQEITSSTSD